MNDFYIGYLKNMPASLVRFIRPAAALIIFMAVALAILFSLGQDRFAAAVFEFGDVKEYEGTIQAKPVAFLIVENGRRANGLPGLERIALVGEGKFGAYDAVKDLDGKRVKLSGTLIYRDDTRMIELVSGSVRESQGKAVSDGNSETDLGMMTLKGEIIDSKCYLGVMNPGNRKTHRSCAVACLRGGVPAMFLVKDSEGRESELWLLSEDGEAVNDLILDYVAEPVELKGRVSRRGDSLFFKADIGSIRRL